MSDGGIVADWERWACTLYDTRDQLKRHIFDRSDQAFAAGDAARDQIANKQSLDERRAKMRQLFLRSIGDLPTDAPSLNIQVTGAAASSGFYIRKLVFESRPGHYVTANVYIPEGREAPGPAVLLLCGHEREGKGSKLYGDVCVTLVQAGLVVMAIDPIGQGERLSYGDAIELSGTESAEASGWRSGGERKAIGWGTHEHQHAGAQCLPLGEGLARYFLHDAMRAIDCMITLPEVDPQRIGVTGNSGGGTQAAMLMLCDSRIAAAAPGTFIMNRKQYMHAGGVQDAEQVWPGLSAAGFDHEDILLAFAPKPLLVLAAAYDFFPIEATRRTVDRARRFWAMYGLDRNLSLFVDNTQHSYTARMADAAAEFFSGALNLADAGEKHDQTDVKAEATERKGSLPLELLLCTQSGQVRLDYAEARTVRDENIISAQQLIRIRSAQPEDELRLRGLDFIRRKVVEPRRSCGLNLRRMPAGEADGLRAEYVLWWSQEGLMNSGLLFSSARQAEAAAAAGEAGTIRKDTLERAAHPSIAIALWERGTAEAARHMAWLKTMCGGGCSVLALNTSGTGPHAPYPIYGKPPYAFFGVMHKLADDLLWLDDSLAAMRTWDVLRVLEVAEQLGAEAEEARLDFHAFGRTGIYVRLAAALEPRIRLKQEQKLSDVARFVGSRDYAEDEAMSYIVPGMLQYFDFPELERWHHDEAARERQGGS